MNKTFPSLLIVLLSCLIMTSGCGSGGGSSDKNPSDADKQSGGNNYIYGIASKGPIRNGFVVVYPLTSAGDTGKVLGTTFTGDDGSYIVGIGSYTGNILVEVKTGQYTDEATKAEKDIGDDKVILRAAVTRVNSSAVAMVTPYTELAVQMAGRLTEANIDRANALAGTVAGGVDIINTRPANVLSEDDIASSNTDEITYGLALASISEVVRNNPGVGVAAVISNISKDLIDGKLDTQGVTLSNALTAFLINGNNLSRISDSSQTWIDEALLLASDISFVKDSSDINQVFKILEDLYSAESLPDENIRGWFDSNIADDYLHDGRIKSDEAEIWTGQGGLYKGVSLSAVLISAMDTTGTAFEKGYWIRVSFSGDKGTGSVLSSMVYDSINQKWLWYGNREWGVGLSNFLPRAEMVVEATGDVSFSNGFDVVIWDYNLSAYDHGIRSAIITGPGLPEKGLKLEHYYRDTQHNSYFSLYPRGSGYQYPLSDDQINGIPDSDEYKYSVRFYSVSADELFLSNPPEPMRTETKTFTKKPVLQSELELNPSLYFPVLTSDSHDLSALNIGELSDVSWTNPADTTVNLVSLSWIDIDGKAQSAPPVYPESNPSTADGSVTVSIDTEGYPAADLTAQLYMRGEDIYGRGISLTWNFWRQAGPQEDVTVINEIFRSLEGLYAASKPSNEEMTNWFNNNVAEDYLHDGRDMTNDLSVWTGDNGLYKGIAISAILLGTMDDVTLPETYEKGYWIMLYFSGPFGSGSIRSSMVYDKANGKWLWYGNRDWGLGLSGFLPWAEKTISPPPSPDVEDEVNYDTGFEMIIWDTNLAAYKQGARSAIITGPGLPDDTGVILKHFYNPDAADSEPYFSIFDPSGSESVGFSYSLTDDKILLISDNSVYNINFYTEPAETVSLSSTPIKTLSRTFDRGPVLKTELESNSLLYFPVLSNPVSHALSDANIGGSLDVVWTNPADMAVNFVSMGWFDTEKGQQYTSEPVYDPDVTTVTIDTTGNAFWWAQLYLRGEDHYYRRFSLTWQFQDSSLSSTLNTLP